MDQEQLSEAHGLGLERRKRELPLRALEAGVEDESPAWRDGEWLPARCAKASLIDCERRAIPARASNDCNAGNTPTAGRGEQAQIEATGVEIID